jgi:translation initiation factor IF-3
VPVPRKFDRRPPERDQTRINDRIRVPEVRLVGEDGKQIGVIKTSDALAYAQERDLDLVEVAPEARPPVCRVLDYSKYKYEQAQKQKAARRHQQQITVREIKFRPKIAQNDYETKRGHVARFLKHKDKVKITIMFRGREVTHPERGIALLDRLAGELEELAVVEQSPLQDGRNMTMLLAPSKAVLAGEKGAEKHPDGDHSAGNGASRNSGSGDESAAPGAENAGAATQPAEPAPQAAQPAPQAAEAASQPVDPAPQAAEPAPQAAEPAPQPGEPAPQAAEAAPQPPEPAPQAVQAAPRAADATPADAAA